MSGKFWKHIWFVGIFVMLGLWIYAAVTGLVNSVAFVSHMSMLALVLAMIAAWQGSRTEQKQDEQNAEQDEDIDELQGRTPS